MIDVDNILTRNDFQHKFSMKLDKIMRKRRMSNRALSEKVEISSTTIDNYRNGKCVPDAYIVYRIARALPCTIESLTDF